jgi:hypothetical protein
MSVDQDSFPQALDSLPQSVDGFKTQQSVAPWMTPGGPHFPRVTIPTIVTDQIPNNRKLKES